MVLEEQDSGRTVGGAQACCQLSIGEGHSSCAFLYGFVAARNEVFSDAEPKGDAARLE